MTTQEEFKRIVDALPHGAIADIAREAGISRRTIERKRDDETPVTRWDLWALERAAQEIGAGADSNSPV